MPEIGEIQAHAERLNTDWAGKTLTAFRPITFYVLKTFAPDPASTHGEVLHRVDTRGKYLRLWMDTAVFIVHLMQGGRLRPDEKQSAKPRGGQARWTFDDGTALLLTEAGTDKRAGVWVMPIDADLDADPPLDYLGPDADSVDESALAGLLGEHSMRLHGFLRRQTIMAGLGRRLANDICHEAQISPFASTGKLSADQIAALHGAIDTCIASSLEFERTQDEIVASAKRPSAVHNRTGEPCPRCGDVIREVAYNKYTVNYCAPCQTSGKVLADNTTSKFLK
ncbi:MAG: DNA-formamidopyrimidine glycosylase family protein [Acidimicrobiia bacterium]|nr:DNA-formamidopyrimidine glycosylase family protein [Acidimicrobiia bacterium]